MSKKVLMIATVPSMIGQFNMSNIRMLLDMGYEVHVAGDFTDTSVWPVERVEIFKNQMEKLGVPCIQIDFSRSALKFRRHIESYWELKRLIAINSYYFVHTHTPIASAIVRLAVKKSNVKVIYTAHGFHFYEGAPLKNWIFFYLVEKVLSRYTDVLITINKEDYTRAKKNLYAKKNIKIPGVGVDTKKFDKCPVTKKEKRRELGIPDNAFVLLSVGEISERKNQRVIIEALGKMKDPNIIYLAAGKGKLEAQYRKLINNYGLEDNIRLLGFRADIGELCKAADCFVHPSVREGLGIAPLEAMVTGLPLISSYIHGIKDYTEEGVSGCCLTDPTNVSDMCKAIRKMKENKEFRLKCGENNRKTALDYDYERTDEIMSEVYRSFEE